MKEYFDNNNKVNPVIIAESISFLTKLTGIQSKSDGNYIGQTSPELEDYKNWTIWYSLTKEFIYWDEESKLIILMKKIPIRRSTPSISVRNL
jgi:hypothetical protein